MNFIYAHGPRKKTPTKQGNFPTGSENFRARGTTEETKRNPSVRQGMWLVTCALHIASKQRCFHKCWRSLVLGAGLAFLVGPACPVYVFSS